MPTQTLHVPRADFARTLVCALKTLSLTLAVIVLWALMHHFQGLVRDGELYAMQAMARVHPYLGADVYLAHGSQDRFTVFSPLYALLIGWMGLKPAALALFIGCTAGLFLASWALIEALAGRRAAWLSLGLLATVSCGYGAYGVFLAAEDYLTARSLAVALVVASLALNSSSRRALAFALAAAALAIHPLMALPGLVLLATLNLPARLAIAGAALGIVGVLATALLALVLNRSSGPLAIIDPQWLTLVRGRAQFLFPAFWRWQDWDLHARMLLCLGLSAAVLDPPVRRLCLCSMLVGCTGLAIAVLAGWIGPLALLVQGQPWRWFWLCSFLAALLLAPTALRLWQDRQGGKLCATLLIASWTLVQMPGTAALACALVLRFLRRRIEPPTARLLDYAAYGVIAIAVGWALANGWSLFTSPRAESSSESLMIDHIRSFFDLQVPAVIAFWALWCGMESARTVAWPLAASAMLAAVAVAILPTTLYWRQQRPGVDSTGAFADWRAAIPPSSNVLVVPTGKSAAFVWFTLERPSYMSVDQSAGVVFSRNTAMEIERRSEVLRPIMPIPDWDILTQIERESHGEKLELTKPLTAAALISVCGDPQLGFVVAKERLGFDARPHTRAGAWKDWYLYDCAHIRTAQTAVSR